MNARITLLAATLSLAACATVGGGSSDDAGPSYPQIAGEWSGSISVEGEALTSSIEITQNGPDLELVTRVPDLGLSTPGEGSILPDGSMRGTFSYNIECPGEAELIGALSSDGTRLSGRLLASDCTGDLEGTFSYRR